MQSIICVSVYSIVSLVLGLILSNFILLSKSKKGEDFKLKEYIQNFNLSNIDLKYTIIFFILFLTVVKEFTLINVLSFSLVFLGLLLAYILDYTFMIIPDTSSILILFGGIINLIFNHSKENIIQSLLGLLFGGLFLFVIDYIFRLITKTEGFGVGDMKLLASIGFMFGLTNIIVIIIMSLVVSAIVGSISLIIKKVKNLKEAYIPFGPFIVISTLIICIIPSQTIIFYFNMFIDSIVNKMI